MPRPAGYYWVKSATDSQLQIVLIQGWFGYLGTIAGQYIAGEKPEIFKGQGLSLEVIAGPLEPPVSQAV